MQQLFHNLRHLHTLRKLLGWATLDEAMKNRLQLEFMESPPTGKVLVLAPHPLDDILGCGGTLAKHRDQGDEVRIVYLCDGRSGTKRATTEIVRDELKNTRRAEAQRSAELLGIPSSNLVFWAYRDNQLQANKTSTKALTQILADFMPRTIYVPHPHEQQPDYLTTASILAKTLEAVGSDIPADIWSYEVWQPTFPNRLVDISATVSQKEAAIAAHVSQEKVRPFTEAIFGLNQHRGGMLGRGGPAEAFLVMNPKFYLKIWDLLRDLN